MVTYGGNRPTVNDNEVLTAQDFNDATRFWVTDELPDNGEDGDVVFVVGDPVGAAAGGGKVLQVVTVIPPGGDRTTTNSSFTDVSDYSVTLTPLSSTSKVIVWMFFNAAPMGSGDVGQVHQVTQNGTRISGSESTVRETDGTALGQTLLAIHESHGGSETTYALQFKVQGSATARVRDAGSLVAMEVEA